MKNIPWVEKYRPVKFENIILDPINRTLFENIIKKKYFPNLLFYGPPGTGKTTTIINLINEYQENYKEGGKGSVIHLNASDERGIDIIRSQINQFVKSNSMFESSYKFVILDEVDYMTKNAQQALKYLLQTSTYNVRFCLICNYISKIDESLQHEFICVRFNQLPKQDIHCFINNICLHENIQITPRDIETIQLLFHSDVRSMINFIQLNKNLSDWNKNIIHQSMWEMFHHDLLNATVTDDTIFYKIHEMSIQYNMDKKNILQNYFHFIIRNKLIMPILQPGSDSVNDLLENDESISVSVSSDKNILHDLSIAKLTELFQLIKNITHITDIPIEIIIRYFICNMRKYYRGLTEEG
jgi:DNA polymerase III delta prime subunit